MRPDMTVKELIERLQALPPEFKVIMAKDSHSGIFYPLSNAELQCYKPPTPGKRLTHGTVEYGPPNAVVLWPRD